MCVKKLPWPQPDLYCWPDIDYSPESGQHFPISRFVPWAAYIQNEQGRHFILEQDELYEALMACSDKNNDQLNLDGVISD